MHYNYHHKKKNLSRIPAQDKTSSEKHFLNTNKTVILICIIGFIVFGNTLVNGFVWDDYAFILNISSGHTLNLVRLLGPNVFNLASYYRPIPAIYFALIYAVAHSHAFLYHLIQIILHIINTLLVFFLFRSLFNLKVIENDEFDQEYFENLSGSQQIKYMREHGHPTKINEAINTYEPHSLTLSLFLSLIFLVHPINVESVSYIASAPSELLFFFGMSALLLSINKNIIGPKILFISGLTLLSLLSKETGFLFLLMILVFQILFYRKRILEFCLFEGIALAIYFFFRLEIGKVYSDKPLFTWPLPIGYISFLERIINIPAIFLYYIQTFFYPLRLSILQIWIVTHPTLQDFYLPLFIDILFFSITCFAGVYLYKYQKQYFKLYIFFFLWFYLSIGMLLQVVPLDLTVSDRWFYSSAVGLLGMFGTLFYAIARFFNNQDTIILHKYKKIMSYITICGVIIIVLLSIRTIIRNTNYHDDLTLNTHDAQVKDNAELEYNIGDDLINQKKYKQAYPHLLRSVNLFPYVDNLQSFGVYYDRIGNVQKAKEYYYKSIEASKIASGYNYDYGQVIASYIYLGDLLLINHNYKEAANVSRMGLQQFPHTRNTPTLQKILETANTMQKFSKSKNILANPCLQTNGQDIVIGNGIIPLSLISNALCKNLHK